MATEPRQGTQDVILNADKPFATQKEARARFDELELDASDWKVTKFADGFAIVRADETEPILPSAPTQREPVKKVRFHNKSNPMDPDTVVLAVNGDSLQIQRNVVVPVPQRFLEVADHAVYKHYSLQPGQERKVDRVIQKFPYDVLGESSWDEFRRWKRDGDKRTRQYAERMGIPLEGAQVEA